jgi:hypothetical protein
MAVNGKENPQDLGSQLPGEIHKEVPGFGVGHPLSEGIKRGKLGHIIDKLHDDGKQVVAKRHPGKIILYVAASAVLIGAVEGGILLRKRRHK